jgi:hypothetical protein
MTDLTPLLNELLMSHDAPPTANPSLTLQNIDEFLKEAYRIVCISKWFLSMRLTKFIEFPYCITEFILTKYPTIIPFHSCPSPKDEPICKRQAMEVLDGSTEGGNRRRNETATSRAQCKHTKSSGRRTVATEYDYYSYAQEICETRTGISREMGSWGSWANEVHRTRTRRIQSECNQ